MSDAANDNNKTVVLSENLLPPAQPPSPPAPQDSKQHAQQNTLSVGTRLGEFEIIGLVGEGGFGIVYLAQDHSLQRRVALKEYMPTSLASRSADSSIFVRSERHRETFEIGRRSFVNEARLLAQFDHPALVKVYRFWEANGTAYMSMPFYEGKTLRDALLERTTAPDEHWIKKILSPVIDSLELIHQEHCYHRDIAPDNIMLLRGDRPVLLDFGAARRVISDMTQALTVILKPGYAPIEQYAEMPGMKQGPWTDVYALAAVVYFMITGRTPPPSVGRMVQDSYRPLALEAADRYDLTFLRGVDKSLSVNSVDRPQSMAEMRDLLGMTQHSRMFAPSPARPAPASSQTNVQPIAQANPSAETPQATPRIERRRRVEPPPIAPDTGMSTSKRIALGLIAAGAVGVGFLMVEKYALREAPVQKGTEESSATQVTKPPDIPSVPVAETKSRVTTAPQAAPASAPNAEPSRAASSTSAVTEIAVEPVKPAPVAKAPVAAKPARKEVVPPPPKATRRKNTPEEEREYVRKLNKDLDNLLQP